MPVVGRDFSGDGVVFAEDFTFILANFFRANDPACCGNQSQMPPTYHRISRTELIQLGLNDLLVADLNHDRWLDEADIAAFLDGARPCEADVDRDGDVNSQDFFTALSGFFAGDFDFDRSGATDSRDFFGFLTAFLSRC